MSNENISFLIDTFFQASVIYQTPLKMYVQTKLYIWENLKSLLNIKIHLLSRAMVQEFDLV